jgi:hypothetical protein
MHAQDSLLFRDYQFVKQQDAWLTSANPAALTRFSSANIAEAEVSLTHQRGGLAQFYESPNLLISEAGIQSFYRINRRTVLFGGISYNNLYGKDMAGSAFIPNLHSSLFTYQTRHPFDIVEDSLTNTGDKQMDVYHLTGAVGTTVFQDIALGARLDYTAANYAKYKDLRHQNRMMDMKATASIYLPITAWLNAGAHYQYHRNIESVSFSTFGTNDKVYKSLVDYGAFMGRLEQFGNTGFTDKSREMPLVDERHGGGLQIELRPFATLQSPLSTLSVFASLSLSHREGYYGKKSPFTITYTNHSGHSTEFTARLSLTLSQSAHRLDCSYATERLQNNAEVFREQKNSSGATYYDYYDPVETADKHWQEGHLSYTADLLVNGEMPTWTVLAGTNWMSRKQTSYFYPFYRYQKLSNQEFFLAVTRNLPVKHGVWSFTLNGSFLKGSGSPYTDGAFVTPDAQQSPAPTMQAYLMREYLYLTAAQYAVGGQLKYSFIFPGTTLKTHARLSVAHRKANETIEYNNGYDRTSATVAIGCSF